MLPLFSSSRCDCYGHGLDCTFDDALQPNPSYKCHCEPRTFTQGDQVSASSFLCSEFVIILTEIRQLLHDFIIASCFEYISLQDRCSHQSKWFSKWIRMGRSNDTCKSKVLIENVTLS